MVLKKSNCGVNSGNTMRPKFYNSLIRPRHSTDHGVIKHHIYNGRIITNNENEEMSELLSEYVDDGGILEHDSQENQYNSNETVIYSLNKRKRWLLSNEVISTIERNNFDTRRCAMPWGEMSEEEGLPFRLVLSERSIAATHVCAIRKRPADCIAYYDSSRYPLNTASFPKVKYSFFSDLRNKGFQKEDTPTVCQKCCNKHFRGIQRRQHFVSSDVESARELPPDSDANDDQKYEIRYEIFHPREATSENHHYYNRVTSGRCFNLVPLSHQKKALKKIKGVRNKESKHDTFIYLDGIYKKEKFEGCKSKRSLLIDDSDWKSDETCYESNRGYDISLESLVSNMAESKPVKKKRKRGRKISLSGKLKISDSNRATSHCIKKYGKGSAIYLDSHKDDDNDFVVLETPTAERTTGIPDSVFITQNNIEDRLKEHEDSFTLCKVTEKDVQPSKLIESYGSSLQIGRAHPVRFTLDLGKSILQNTVHSDAADTECFLMCRVIAGDSLWTDPTEEASISISVVAYGSLDCESLKKINSRLRASLTSELVVYSLKEVVTIAQQCLATQTYQKTLLKPGGFRNENNPVGNTCKSILSEKFGAGVEISTAKDIYLKKCRRDKSVDWSQAVSDLWKTGALSVTECDICVTPLHNCDGVPQNYIVLEPCCHGYCQQCWQTYLFEKIQQGVTVMFCMGDKCETKIDFVTVASLVPVKDYQRWRRFCHEQAMLEDGNWKWCPSPSCSYLIRQSGNGKPTNMISVTCLCGLRFCVLCQKPAHSPATCEQANIYYKMLLQNGDEGGRRMPETITFSVDVKSCPNCHYPMQKSGGCFHMTCRCHYQFCWDCLGSWFDHERGLVCVPSTMVTMTLDNSIMYPLPTIYYKKAIAYRHKRLQEKLPKTSSFEFCFRNLTPSRKRKARQMNFSMSLASKCVQTDPAPVFKVVHKAVTYLKEIHKILEYTFVLMSHTTRTMHCYSFLFCISRLEFVCVQIEQIVSLSPRKICNEIQRLEHLMELATRLVRSIARSAPNIRERTQENKQKQVTNILQMSFK